VKSRCFATQISVRTPDHNRIKIKPLVTMWFQDRYTVSNTGMERFLEMSRAIAAVACLFSSSCLSASDDKQPSYPSYRYRLRLGFIRALEWDRAQHSVR
jgi:hypothetical protein